MIDIELTEIDRGRSFIPGGVNSGYHAAFGPPLLGHDDPDFGCYHGWHDSAAMNVISPADRVGGQAVLARR